MRMSCAEAEELLGAYALDALDETQARRLEEHLRGCQEHAEAAAGLRATQSLLALAVEDVEPPAGLRGRIVQAVASMPSTQARADSEPPARRAPTAEPTRRGLRPWGWTPRRAYAAVAAALLLSLGIGGVIGYQISASRQPISYAFQGDVSRAPGAEARLVYFRDRQQAVLLVSGLPRLAAGRVYELWLIKGGVPVDEGISADPNGNVQARITADVTKFDELAITIEPGEQPLPTTTPILIGNLRTPA